MYNGYVIFLVLMCHMNLQWNLSIVNTLGTAESVLIGEVSTFQGFIYLAGIHNHVLIKEVSLFQGCDYRGVPLCCLPPFPWDAYILKITPYAVVP